ncbi:hypothetical protein RU639_010101 [Aspergillus parasiticus]
MTTRSTSPAKRHRVLDDADNVHPDQIASATPVTELTEGTRLSNLSSSSPSKQNAAALFTSLTQGLHEQVIPIRLKDRISASFPLMANDIPNSAYDNTDNSSDRELDILWHTIMVVYPMLQLAFKGSMLKAENVSMIKLGFGPFAGSSHLTAGLFPAPSRKGSRYLSYLTNHERPFHVSYHGW